ncbi:MAG: endonuclease/exonuclease/phosphatase family protein [Aureispira sp.]|nr:endonuclease/exonuclease/phosphatase family protein [Aureispira sp.]
MQLRAMTYNILFKSSRFDKMPNKQWQNRREYVIERIKMHYPNILAIQEGTTTQVQELQAALPKYAYYGVHNKPEGEQVGIFYEKAIFELENANTFWLSTTPNQPSKSWESANPRICSYVQLLHKVSQQTVFYFNTHLDHKSALARIEGIKVILSKIKELQTAFPKAFFAFSGDLNANTKTAVYQELSKASFLQDCFHSTLDKAQELNYTFVGIDKKWTWTKFLLFCFYPRFMHKRIDHVFVSKNWKTQRYLIDNWANAQGYYPSDHLPIIVDLKMY